jgi:hypothetical protein
MTPLLLLLLASGPCVYWNQGIDSRASLESAGVKKLCVPPDLAGAWKTAGFSVTPAPAPDLSSREELPAPGVAPRAGVASPTRAPWIVANGWHIARNPQAKYVYSVPAGKAALAAAEAFAYGADAVLKIEPADLPNAAAMLAFLDTVPSANLPAVADFAVVDDGSPVTGEVMNLLSRRNLLFEIVKEPDSRLPVNVRIGSPGYSKEEAADPSTFAQKIRSQLTDDRRSLRLYGSEVVIARLTSDGPRARVHLINYGGREIEGLRVRVKGTYKSGEAYIAGSGKVALVDQSATDGATEFSLPRFLTYAVIDLK